MQAPGFFGKLASHGDFVTRRLPPPFVAAWDGWLQSCLHASRETLGEAWLDAYLTAPVWRFALAPDALTVGCAPERTRSQLACTDSVRTSAHPTASCAWAGILLPSVDRVGRHFPLTLAACAAGPLPLECWLQAGDWYGQLETLALSTLAPAFSFDHFESALREMAPLPAAPVTGEHDTHGWSWKLDDAGRAAALAAEVAAAALQGHSIWWTEGSDRVGPCMRLFRGLPPAQAFAGMLAG